MTHIERGIEVDNVTVSRTARQPRAVIALLAAVLRPLARGQAARLLATASVLALLGLLLTVTPALAAGPPGISHCPGTGTVEEVHSTRVRLDIQVGPEGSETHWRSEYATSEAGPYTLLDSGTLVSIKLEQKAYVGTAEPWYGNVYPILRHLTPETTYYFRFSAENADGQAVRNCKLTTLPVAKPETAHNLDNTSELSFRLSAFPLPTALSFQAKVESNGAPTQYGFAYSTSPSGPWTPFTSGASGTIGLAEDLGQLEAAVSGLQPETMYYLRLQATNGAGSTEEVISQETTTELPMVIETHFSNVTGSSAHLRASVSPHGSKTDWRFEYAPAAAGPWSPVPGASGTVSQAEAEARFYPGSLPVSGDLGGLEPSTTYYVRLFAESEAGVGLNGFHEPIPTATRGLASFETEGPPSASTFATHALHGEAIRILGSVDPNGSPTTEIQQIALQGGASAGTFTLSLNGQTTAPIPFGAPANAVFSALSALPGAPQLGVNGPDGGPYVVEFNTSSDGVDQPQIGGDGSGLSPSGIISVTTVQQGGETYDTRYRFEYESQRQLEEAGGTEPLAEATSTPEVDLGAGAAPAVVGVDLPGLSPGETYYYRLLASSDFPGNPVIEGETQTLRVADPSIEPPPACANQALRTGPAGHLSDCRAYEQVTPTDKEGATEPLTYGGSVIQGILPGEDGDHLVVAAPLIHWGAGPGAGQSPYVFSRDLASGWQMTAATPQPQAGISAYFAQVFSPDLTSLGLYGEWATSSHTSSEDLEFMTGPPGGPYAPITSVPRTAMPDGTGNGEGLVAASEDFSKLLLANQDHDLLAPTHTKSGTDLYEYSAGELRQLNVDDGGVTIGSCGAKVAHGLEGEASVSSRHALSADGSRVFFQAVPGSNCSQPAHLYMRLDGESTLDIGSYRFLGADAAGARVLVENPSGELFLYRADSSSLQPLTYGAQPRPLSLGTEGHFQTFDSVRVSEDLSAIYFAAGKLDAEAPPIRAGVTDYYRYDIPTQTLRFVAQGKDNGQYFHIDSVSPDGRYLYLQAVEVAGVPAAGERLPGEDENIDNTQIFRYDAAESLLDCVSCASPSDPAPRLNANFVDYNTNGGFPTNQGMPRVTVAAADGSRVFFQTPAALLPADVDGEVAPKIDGGGDFANAVVTPSSDIYEWRRAGLEGCVSPQGCLSLISSGRGGYHVSLLGADESGRDVFFYTKESLLPSDNDSAGDIYDARVGGGFSTPSRPDECEGDACSRPLPAPDDSTPASESFRGAGNVTECPRGKVSEAGKCVARHHKKHHQKKSHKKHKRTANTNRRAGK